MFTKKLIKYSYIFLINIEKTLNYLMSLDKILEFYFSDYLRKLVL